MNSGVQLSIAADGVAWIRLDDGKVNALSCERLRAVAGALEQAAAADVTVLAGRPGIFSAGFHLPTFKEGPLAAREMVEAGIDLIEQMLRHPTPIIAMCTGHAYPMGAFLMLCADLRLGASGAFRIGMNEVAIGLTVPHFALELARHRLSAAGFARISTAAMVGPKEAVALGYLDQVFAPERLETEVATLAQSLRALDPGSYRRTKERINAEVLARIAAAREHYEPGGAP